MSGFPYLERGRCRVFSDTCNWALYGKIYDLDFITESGFNVYYGDLFGSGEETFPRHMAHRSLDFQRQHLDVNRPHIEAVKEAGMAYIYYSSICTFDANFFDDATVSAFASEYGKNVNAFGTPGRRFACLNSPEWFRFQVEKTVMLVEELGFDGVFWDNLFYMMPCRCQHCVEKYRLTTGLDLLEVEEEISVVDIDEVVHNKGLIEHELTGLDLGGYKKYLQYAEFRRHNMEDFIRKYRSEVEARTGKPFAILVNIHLPAAEGMEVCRADLLDAYYTENGYTFPPETNEFSYRVGAAIHPEKRRSVIVVTRTLEGMPSPGMLKTALGEGMANGGCLTPWGFYLHESANHKHETVRYMRFYEEHEELFARQDNVADAAIVVPINANLLRKLAGDEQQYMNSGAFVASRVLSDINIPYDVIFDKDLWDFETLKKYRLLVLPEVDLLSDHNFKVLQRMAESGTHILLTSNSLRWDEELCLRDAVLTGRNVVNLREPFSRDYCNVRLTEKYDEIFKFEHTSKLAEMYEGGILKTTAAALTHITLTKSSTEVICHFVNYNVNRGPFSIRAIPDYNIECELLADRQITEAWLYSPDVMNEAARLPVEVVGNKAKIVLPKLEYYSFVLLR